MTRNFCTYFDHRYLPRGMAMYLSLKRHCPSARVWVLCLSDECHRSIADLGWPDFIGIKLADFEKNDDALQAAKANRSQVEYYFTCTPSLPLFILRNNPEVDLITYVDSDLYFFSDPEPVFQEIGVRSIAIIRHGFTPENKWMEKRGVFNVGWLTFRRDENGLACLSWWRERCLEWCHDYIDGDRYADQKYLDQFPKLFKNLAVIEHKGANVATWNLGNYTLHERNGQLWVDDQPVVFCHFHGVRKIAPGVVDPAVRQYGLRLSLLMERKLFRPYMRELSAQKKAVRISAAAGRFTGLHRKVDKHDQGLRRSGLRNFVRMLAAYYGLMTRRFLLSRGA
jgi:hypothetical protein